MMMKTKAEIEKEVEMTLQSAEIFTRYEGKPFLLTRVMARLEKAPNTKPAYLPQLVLQPYLLTFILLLNIFSVVYLFSNTKNTDQNRDQYIDQLAEEFSISANSYDLSTLIKEE